MKFLRALKARHRELEKGRKQFGGYVTEWRIERDIASLAKGTDPIIVGPWLAEVGYEVLYWVPFVRRMQARYRIDPERIVVVTRGGADVWYAGLHTRSVEVFDIIDPATFAARNDARAAEGAGTLKQWSVSDMDREILDGVRSRIGSSRARVLHPSMLHRLFHLFWLGHRPMKFYGRHTRHRLVPTPVVELPPDLPSNYVAVKFYTALSLPPTPSVKSTLQSLVLALAEQGPVVMLDTGLRLDDHADHTIETSARVYTLRGRLDPRTNLAVQTAIIGGARSFVGTCGSVAWLAPMLGVNTTAVMAEPRWLHEHLRVARRVYQGLEGAGRFSVLDIGAFEQLGLRPQLHSTL